MRLLPLALLLLTLPAIAQGPGVSRELAQSRAARLSNLHYDLAFTLTPKAPTTEGHEVLTFTNSATNDLPIDFRDGTITSVTLNTKSLPTSLTDGHLILPAAALLQGINTLTIAFTANIAPAGKAITRYLDKDDRSEYLYTLFVPMDASMAFPCFDQPDLKARFSLHVITPFDWAVISNVDGVHLTFDEIPGHLLNHFHFPDTAPISTYLFAFAAGPFARIPPTHPGEPTVYVRKSQLAKATAEAPEVQSVTQKGVAYLADYFAQPFPFPKYDLVLIPGFPFGGMEHAGATFLNEDGILFRSTPTASDRFRRDILVLHETAHQWFGDLVTMRWFDDLWLKEGFAQYMAYKAMAQLKPDTNPWKHFNEDIKPLAYAIDETQGTTPIFQNIPNLKDAKSAYGAIVYQKAPAILKQLNFRLGDATFRDGLRLYLKQHAYANAQWADLIHAFTDAGGKDVKPWADAWITRRGMPEISASFTCSAGMLRTLTLTQRDLLPDAYTWPITNEILLSFPPPAHPMESARATSTYRVTWSTPTVSVTEAIGHPCPQYIFTNSNDQAYGRFLLDPTSQRAITKALGGPSFAAPSQRVGSRTTPKLRPHQPAKPAEACAPSSPASSARVGCPAPAASLTNTPQDPLLQTQLWTALWENVRTAHSSPASYVALALPALAAETDESLARIQGARIAQSLHAYMGPRARAAALPHAESIAATRMIAAPTLNLRIVSFRTFTALAETPQALAQLQQILAGTLTIPGLTLTSQDRWNILAHLAQQNAPAAPVLIAAEIEHDHSGEAQKYAYAAQAALPTAPTKALYFADYLATTSPTPPATASPTPAATANPTPPATASPRPPATASPTPPALVQEDWLTQSLRPFNSWNQTTLTLPYLTRALDALPEIKLHRKIFFLGAWLSAFIDGQSSPAAQRIVHTWLAQSLSGPNLDPDLRLKVLELSDALDRTVHIRQTYPN